MSVVRYGRSGAAAFISVLMLALPAFAADLPIKAPVVTSVTSNDGIYQLLYNQELRFVTWDGTRGYRPDNIPRTQSAGSGSQFYTPMALSLFGNPTPDWSFDALIRAGYVDSRQSTPGQSGHYAGMIDTIASAKVVYKGHPWFQPFVSVTANLPTGETRLGLNHFARMDPDIVDVPTFGEGFNIGPTVGAVIPVPSLNTTFAVAQGYTNRGSYDRDDPDPAVISRHVSPGDEWTSVFNFVTRLGPLTLSGGVNYNQSGTTSVTGFLGTVVVKPGDVLSLRAGANYRWSPEWMSNVGVGWSHAGSSTFTLSTVNPLGPTESASPDIWRVNAGHYYLNGPWTFGVNGLYLKRNGNEFSPNLVEFIPAKTKWQAEGVIYYRPLPNVRLDLRVARIWTEQDAIGSWVIPIRGGCCAFPSTGVPEVHQDAWSFTLGGMIAFDPL